MSEPLTWKDVQSAISKEKASPAFVTIDPLYWNGGAWIYYRRGLFPLIRKFADKHDMPRLYNWTIKIKWIEPLKYLYDKLFVEPL